MKNIFKLIPLAVITLFFTACGDINKEPFEVNGNDGPFGTFVRLDITSAAVLDVTDIANTSFGGTLTAPSNNVASWTVEVRRVSNGEASDYFPLVTITSFPAEFVATPASLAAVFGITTGDLIPGDRFDFEATSIGADGAVVTFDDFGPNLQGNPAQAQGYRFNTFLSCPFIQADALGTYALISNDAVGFQGANTTVEVIAGNTSNDITMVDPIGHIDFPAGIPPDFYNVEINVNAGSGQATVVNQPAYHSGHPIYGGTPYGPGTVDGGGFVFSCAGAIVLNLTFRVAAGSFGSTPFVLQKL